MKSFTKYINANEESKNWGFYINVIGRNEIAPNNKYPQSGHPNKYLFRWEYGRVHEDFHLIYITKGGGVYENESKSYNVIEGDIILIKSGEWHRYKPNLETGWHENYIGFNGDIAQHFVSKIGNYIKNPIISLGKNEEILGLFDKVFEIVDNEMPCYQLTASSFVIEIMSKIISNFKQRDYDLLGDKTAEMINEVRFIIRDGVEQEFDFIEIAKDYNITYSYFRKVFKRHTGFSPLQYQINLRINLAKDLLKGSNKSVKEIAYTLGFKSTHYFSRIFKQKTDISPSEVRKIVTVEV
ncbi:MAG: AraC family transcriptional regulator [Ichthyobacteriaceae bacterium]|nr:AraC family transcriptional regulator [Ichthyobacteriaceae bacterium]